MKGSNNQISMKNFKPIASIVLMSLALSIMGCSTNSESKSTRALFDTKKEAEEAAKGFNCKGAHKMGNKWMPCKSHDAHKKGAQHKKDGGHHHDH
tara:strand:- start:372 stop:656 length:285 start_codon:yes stop_codon:yes gene_type:complete